MTVDKNSCRKSLLLDDPHRREVLAEHLDAVKWDILATNLAKHEARRFPVDETLSEISDASLSRFMDAFLAGITTIPYFKAITVKDEYYVEGGYLDKTPMRSLFEDPDVGEIIAIDFTDYDDQTELERLYHTQMITLPFKH